MLPIRFLALMLLLVYGGLVQSANNNVVTDDTIEPLLPLEEKIMAPDFNLLDVKGQSHSLSDYKDRVLVVNFWARWCAPCRHEMPALQSLDDQLQAQGLSVIGINMGETQDAVQQYLDTIELDFPLLLDEDLIATAAWEVQQLPTTFVVNRQGQIIYAEVGAIEWDNAVIVQQLQALLQDRTYANRRQMAPNGVIK